MPDDRAAFFLEGMLKLERYAAEDRRGVFRQSIASLALTPLGRAPLEGRDGRAIARSVKIALGDGLFDDLGWLAAPAAGVALYEIARALPQGAERRELQRRLGVLLHEGNAATFVAIATKMAVASERGLGVSTIRVRVALSVSLPGTLDVPVDPLALALVGQRELAADWLMARSVGSLPERRLAARLLERAAREAEGRALQGDDDPIRLFRRALRAPADQREGASAIQAAFRPLLADREPLVWRHVAAARGLLAAAVPELRAEIEAGLAANLSPTEWRRAATSLVASIAVAPDRALPAAIDLLRGPLLERDPGITTAMLWGIPRAADAEPEAASELLDAIARAAPLFVAETLVDLRAEIGPIGGPAAERCADALADTLGRVGEEDVLALGHAILSDLRSDIAQRDGERDARAAVKLGVELRAALSQAVTAFIEVGTREAHAHAQAAAQRAFEAVTALEAIAVDRTGLPAAGRGRAVAAILLRELDTQLLESGLLRSLLALNRLPRDASHDPGPVDDLEERLARWLIRTTAVPVVTEGTPRHIALHQRRLRALLHLIDGDTSELEEDPERRARLRERWSSACSLLLDRLSVEVTSPMHRAIVATVARGLDALLRDGAIDTADVLLYAAKRATVPGDVGVLAEASMQPEASRLLRAYARFLGEGDGASPAARLAALDALIAEIPAGATPRLDALRNALSRLARSLSSVQAAAALRPLADPDASALAALEAALDRLAQLTEGALQRCGGEAGDPPSAPPSRYPLVISAGRAVQPGADIQAELGPAITAVNARARALIPRALAEMCSGVLSRVAALPPELPSAGSAALPRAARRSEAPPAMDARLPAWLPSRRTLGGFYVQRQLGGGAAGTVFLVTRAEERHDPNAERFALKVPEYDATAARSLSEADFLKLFRDEAGALLAVPEHENLARFVTFDAGARPKPILVMELIEGTRCDQLIASRLITVPRAFTILDGVLAGLQAMHSVGVGHLDIKPSNVILRDTGAPVLVDFGLAGRHIRPGCATSAYGAPEVWGIAPEGGPTPLTADVYSFGCFAYEVLTAETLFDAPHEIAMITAHLTHDGQPPPIQRLAAAPATAALARFLQRCLRRSPKERATVADLRAALGAVQATLASVSWPIPA